MAGSLGVGLGYREMTYYELSEMYKGKLMLGWEFTSHVLAFINNVHCTKSSHLKSPQELNPFIAHRAKKDISELLNQL